MSRYKLVSIEKSVMPQGAQDGNWYCYVIASENSTITGYRTGSHSEVTKMAEDWVKQMNDKCGDKVRYNFSRPAFQNELLFF